jgi:hypothetical protein
MYVALTRPNPAGDTALDTRDREPLTGTYLQIVNTKNNFKKLSSVPNLILHFQCNKLFLSEQHLYQYFYDLF